MRFTSGELEVVDESGFGELEARDLVVRIPDGKVLLDHVSLDAEPGTLTAIVGPSGSGKSTLLMALCGFQPATSGSVTFDGIPVYGNPEWMATRLGYVPQRDIVHPFLTPKQELTFAAGLRFPESTTPAQLGARVAEVLGQVDLAERAETKINRLSGGQQKRVSMAVELLTKPPLLFLDEPTSGLDPGLEHEVMKLLRSIADEGSTVVVVTHSVQSLELCDRVLFLGQGGRLAFFGPPAESLPYFRTFGRASDYADIFDLLEADDAPDWKAGFERSGAFERYVSEPLDDVAEPTRATRVSPRRPQAQFKVLVRRDAAVLTADPTTVIMLLAQAPVLGLLLLFGVLSVDRFQLSQGVYATAGVWLLVLAATWLGASNSIRTIVKEAPQYQRERLVGLGRWPYVLSKFAVLGICTVAQCLVVTFIALSRQSLPPKIPTDVLMTNSVQLPTTGAVLGSQTTEIVIAVLLSGLAAMALGLFISASVKSSDRAVILLPVVLVTEAVLSIPALGDRMVGVIASATWGTAAAGSSLDLDSFGTGVALDRLGLHVEGIQSVVVPGLDVPLWHHDSAHWLVPIMVLLGFIAIFVVGCVWMLRTKELSDRGR